MSEMESEKRPGRSVGAVALGFVVVVVLSMGTDVVLHWREFFRS